MEVTESLIIHDRLLKEDKFANCDVADVKFSQQSIEFSMHMSKNSKKEDQII